MYRKHEPWNFLKHLHARAKIPWVFLGDFNDILHSTEKQGRLPKPLAPMLSFKETFLQCGPEDLGFQGHPFTWQNGHPGDAFMQERLDRACATTLWQVMFPKARVFLL